MRCRGDRVIPRCSAFRRGFARACAAYAVRHACVARRTFILVDATGYAVSPLSASAARYMSRCPRIYARYGRPYASRSAPLQCREHALRAICGEASHARHQYAPTGPARRALRAASLLRQERARLFTGATPVGRHAADAMPYSATRLIEMGDTRLAFHETLPQATRTPPRDIHAVPTLFDHMSFTLFIRLFDVMIMSVCFTDMLAARGGAPPVVLKILKACLVHLQMPSFGRRGEAGFHARAAWRPFTLRPPPSTARQMPLAHAMSLMMPV